MVAAGGQARSRGGKRTSTNGPTQGTGGAAPVLVAGAVRLRAAILARWGTLDAFEAWAKTHAREYNYRPLTAKSLDQIERGSIPPLPRIIGLAIAADLPFEDVAKALGIDFGELPRLRAALGSSFTRIEPASLVFPTRLFNVPVDLTAWVDPFKPERLLSMVSRWAGATVSSLNAHLRPHRVTVLLDEPYGLGYPRIPLRALLQIDTADVEPVAHAQERFYLVQHPYGWGCCRVTRGPEGVTLHSEDRDYHPSLHLSADQVKIHGRVVAFAARLDGLPRPAPRPMSELRRGQAWPGPEFWREASPTEMLQLVWDRREFSYHQRLLEDVRRLHGLTTQLQRPHDGQRRRGGSLSAGALKQHLSPDPHTRVTPVLTTLFALAAVFGVEVRDLLRAYRLPGTAPARGAPTAAFLDKLRASAFGTHLERQGWDLAWLLSLMRWGHVDSVYHVGTSNFEMQPLLMPNAFVAIDPFQLPETRSGGAADGEAASSGSDWERPFYFLQTNERPGGFCAYCEIEEDRLHVVPHPRGTRRTVEHLPRREAAVLGRVTHVATLVP